MRVLFTGILLGSTGGLHDFVAGKKVLHNDEEPLQAGG
jgi:hypothetical protein